MSSSPKRVRVDDPADTNTETETETETETWEDEEKTALEKAGYAFPDKFHIHIIEFEAEEFLCKKKGKTLVPGTYDGADANEPVPMTGRVLIMISDQDTVFLREMEYAPFTKKELFRVIAEFMVDKKIDELQHVYLENVGYAVFESITVVFPRYDT